MDVQVQPAVQAPFTTGQTVGAAQVPPAASGPQPVASPHSSGSVMDPQEVGVPVQAESHRQPESDAQLLTSRSAHGLGALKQ